MLTPDGLLSTTEGFLLPHGSHSDRPAATDLSPGALYGCDTHHLIYQVTRSGNLSGIAPSMSWTTWADVSAAGGISAARWEPNSGTDPTTTSTTLTNLGSASVAIAATVGDLLETTLTGTLYPTNTGALPMWVQMGFSYGGTDAGQQVRHWFDTQTSKALTITLQHVVVSGDLSSWTVTVRPRWKVSAGGVGLVDGSVSGLYGQLSVKNLRQ